MYRMRKAKPTWRHRERNPDRERKRGGEGKREGDYTECLSAIQCNTVVKSSGS